jgi:hypothetical protein
VNQFEIRYRDFKRGRRSERTVKIEANTQTEAKQEFLSSVPVARVKILSIFILPKTG